MNGRDSPARLSRGLLFRTAAVAIGLLGATGLCTVILSDASRRPAAAETFAWLRSPVSLPKLWLVPGFSLVDQRGTRVTLESLHARPFVADFIFTECTTACPLMTSKMVSLQRRLVGRSIRFLSFSVDPEHDTPSVLAHYAKSWNPLETRWSLLSTTRSTLAKVAAGFRITAAGGGPSEAPIMHSTVFLLVDGDGFVRGVYDSADPAAMSVLGSAAESLSRRDTRPVTGAPGTLYASLGCAGCHDRPTVAPPLVNLRGAHRKLEGDASITVDESYLRTSILDPGRDRVAGYAVAMPSYREQLTDAEVDALVAELLDRTSDDAQANPSSEEVVIDPVCGMKVRVEREALHANYGGKTYYFCSSACRESFVRTPMRYTGAL